MSGIENGSMTSHRTPNLRSSTQNALTSLREARRQRGLVRAERRQLERELASYATMADVDDLLGSLRGQDEASTDAIRTVVLRNLQSNQRLAGVAS